MLSVFHSVQVTVLVITTPLSGMELFIMRKPLTFKFLCGNTALFFSLVIFLFVLFFNWVNLMLVKMRDQYHWLEQGTSQTLHVQLCQCTSILFFFFFFLVFIYILFNLVLVKGAGLTTLEAEALYLSTEQIQHGRQPCKLPHAAPTNVPHLCPGGTTSRGERIVQSPWPIQSLAFLLRLPTKLR